MLLGPDVAEPARRFEQPVVICPTGGAALKMDRRIPVNTGWVLPGKLQPDVGGEDPGASGTARVSIARPQELIQVAKISHRSTYFVSKAFRYCHPRGQLTLATNRFFWIGARYLSWFTAGYSSGCPHTRAQRSRITSERRVLPDRRPDGLTLPFDVLRSAGTLTDTRRPAVTPDTVARRLRSGGAAAGQSR